ncbi:dihydrolipoamide acetyltransferase family protein [Lysinibacillus sp. 54212]|uniref:dihydrolipoamide acetyltransferase family protein n=1 Tax=Lysinibacillus sp. 54212 TaxID=3119829 RepID=UPI002FCC2FD3
MPIQNITMPQLGESVTEGTIERWLVKPGDVVKKYDPLAEVNTDKVNAEIPSSFGGKIISISAKEGETLPVGAVVCTIEVESDTQLSAAPVEKKSNVSEAIRNAGMQNSNVQSEKKTPARELREAKAKARYSPAVLMLASEHAINLESIQGTGLDGRITRKDVLAYIESGQNEKVTSTKDQKNNATQEDPSTTLPSVHEFAPSNPQQQLPGDIEIPVTSVRRAIANNMVRSKQEVPHAWMMMEADVTDLVAYRDRIKDEFKQREGYNLTYFAFFLKAIAIALKEYPMMNSMWAGDKIIQKRDINLSIAVATDDALFVPVIKHADEKSIKGIAKEIHELSQLVKLGKLRPEHISGGTFTVNNTGSFGSVQSMGIINYPQAAILQVEAIVKKPVIFSGNMFAPRDIVNLCLSLDHRVLDGLICAKFLKRVKEILENANNSMMSVY